jgi:hypothetical protein
MSGIERAVAEMGALKLSVRIDGEWCPEVRWYTPDLPVFIAEDGTEVDIRDDGSILYESPEGAVEELEPVEENDGQEIYEPNSVYPADRIEVRHINRRPIRSEPADFGGGESTGVQDL